MNKSDTSELDFILKATTTELKDRDRAILRVAKNDIGMYEYELARGALQKHGFTIRTVEMYTNDTMRIIWETDPTKLFSIFTYSENATNEVAYAIAEWIKQKGITETFLEYHKTNDGIIDFVNDNGADYTEFEDDIPNIAALPSLFDYAKYILRLYAENYTLLSEYYEEIGNPDNQPNDFVMLANVRFAIQRAIEDIVRENDEELGIRVYGELLEITR